MTAPAGSSRTGPGSSPSTGDHWLSATEQATWRQLLLVHARLMERLDDDLRAAHGLGLGDFDVLVSLAEGPDGGLRMRELAGRLMLSPSGLTRRIDRLVRRGLVARDLCPSDGRGALARLTESGAAALAASAPTHVASVRRYLIGPLGPSGVARLGTALEELAAALAVDQRGASDRTTGRPLAAQPLVPPATDSAG